MSIFNRRRGSINLERDLGAEVAAEHTDVIEVYDEVDGRVLIFDDETALSQWENTGEATWARTRPCAPEDETALGSLAA